jgi:FkbM family methyltransferase
MLKNFMYDLVEDYVIENYNAKKLSLMSDVIICTNSSLELIKKMRAEQLKLILHECYRVKESNAQILYDVGFNRNSKDIASMVKLKFSSNYMFINTLDPWGKLLSVYGGHEFITLKVLGAMLKENDTYVEIGANYGDFLLALSERVSYGGKVYGFEPSTTVFPYLQASVDISKHQNTIIENKAVSDKNGFVTFEITDLVEGYDSLGSAIKSELNNYSSAKEVREVQVESVKLDDYFYSNKISPTLIRLDIEGSECKAIRGLQDTIKQYKPHLSIEFQSSLIKKFESDYSIQKCLSILYDNSYDVRDLYSLEYINQDSVIDAYNKHQDRELLCSYNNQQLIEDLQSSIYSNGGWSSDIQAAGDL